MGGSRRIGGFKKKLLDRSIEAYILALGTINNLSITYRVESFTQLICNAWELLLKAKILHDKHTKKSIYYRQKPGESKGPRTLALRDCMKKVFKENDPVRRNIELVEELRDEATHLVISQVPKDILGLFQACVLNYHEHLAAWFNMSLAQRVNVGMMTIVYDFKPDELDLSNQSLRRQLGRDTAEYLTQFQAKLRQEYAELGRPREFAIDINFKLAYTKKQEEADILIAPSSVGVATRVIEVPKDPSRTHPYRQVELINHVNTALGAKVINQYDIQCVIKLYNIKKRPEYFYQGGIVGSPVQYSQVFGNWLVGQYRTDPNFFLKVRQQAQLSKGKQEKAGRIATKYEDLADVAGSLDNFTKADVATGSRQNVEKM